MPASPPWRAFGAVWFFYFSSTGLFYPFSGLWFQSLGFSALAIGGIGSLLSWTRIVAPYAWGWLGDHSGERVRLLRLAAAASLLAASGLLWARGETAVAVVCALLFLANGGVVPLTEATLARHLATANGLDSTRYGRIRLWGSLGFIVAVLVFGRVLDVAGIGLFPLLLLATLGLLLVASFRLPGAPDDLSGHARPPHVLSVLRRPEVAWFFASIFFTVLAHSALYNFFSLYLVALGLDKSAVGALWALSVAVEIVFFWSQGRFFDRLSPHGWLQWAAAASVLRFAALAAWGADTRVLVGSQLLHAITFAAQHAACVVLVSRHFPGALRGRGQALYPVLGYGLSGVLGGVAGGWLTVRYGYAAVFWAASAAAVVGLACATLARRAARSPPDQSG